MSSSTWGRPPSIRAPFRDPDSARPCTPTPQLSRTSRAASLLPSSASLKAFPGHEPLSYELTAAQQLEQERKRSSQRLLDTWAIIAEKYGNLDPDDDDEVDLVTGEIVRSRGKLDSMKRIEFGEACGDLYSDEEDDSTEDDEEAEQSTAGTDCKTPVGDQILNEEGDDDILDSWNPGSFDPQIEYNIPEFLRPAMERLKSTAKWTKEDDEDLKAFLKLEEDKRAQRGDCPIAEDIDREKDSADDAPLSPLGSISVKPVDTKPAIPVAVTPRLSGTVHLPIDLTQARDQFEEDPLSDPIVGAPASEDLPSPEASAQGVSPVRPFSLRSLRGATPSPLLKSALRQNQVKHTSSPLVHEWMSAPVLGHTPLSRSRLSSGRDGKTPSSPLGPHSRAPRQVTPPIPSVAGPSSSRSKQDCKPSATELDLQNATINVTLTIDSRTCAVKEEPADLILPTRLRTNRPRRVIYPEPERPRGESRQPKQHSMDVKAEMGLDDNASGQKASWAAKGKWKDETSSRISHPPGRRASGQEEHPTLGRQRQRRSDLATPSRRHPLDRVDVIIPPIIDVRDIRESSRYQAAGMGFGLPAARALSTGQEETLVEDNAGPSIRRPGRERSSRKNFRAFYLTPGEAPVQARKQDSALRAVRGSKKLGRPRFTCLVCLKAERPTFHVCEGRKKGRECQFKGDSEDLEVLRHLMERAIAEQATVPMSESPQKRDVVKVEDDPTALSSRTRNIARRRPSYIVKKKLDPSLSAIKVEETRPTTTSHPLPDPPTEGKPTISTPKGLVKERNAMHDMNVICSQPDVGIPAAEPGNIGASSQPKSRARSGRMRSPKKDQGDVPLESPVTGGRVDVEQSTLHGPQSSSNLSDKADASSSTRGGVEPAESDDDDILLLGRRWFDDTVKVEASLPSPDGMPTNGLNGLTSSSSKRKTDSTAVTPSKRVKWAGADATPKGWNAATPFIQGTEVIDVDVWQPLADVSDDELDEW